ncbi:MAG: rubrerythrin [Nanoarchaeota archaeon]|nr:rubrerythrin family protein [Nanoarchaeota archaeon]MBU4300925.1 rubrerythrin family protein [Nanoarchaeota archaeon]MBU4451530.1 rubrerythrin family protein [Nanoarchaeota archaeon]MCG2723271.1 rubrerythrin family protein [archaeon]
MAAKTKTEENLMKAFAGESMARNKYNFFANIARKEGFEQVAAIFDETADNEKEHAKKIAKLLANIIGDTKNNLKAAIEGENYEHTIMYPEFEKAARAEGNLEAAEFFKHVAMVEVEHHKRYDALLKNLETGKVFQKDAPVKWKCRNCGYVHEGRDALKVCPACLHPQSFQEVKAQNY